MEQQKPTPGTGGNIYVPFEKRAGKESVVYFTRDLSAAGLTRIYEKVAPGLTGKIAVKLHTGEAEGPNILPRPWVRELTERYLPNGTIVETNSYYEGSRYTTEAHRKTLKINGWDFCPVDIMDADGVAALPVKGGKWFSEMHVGQNLLRYDSLLTLTHFKGHSNGGFGGSNKNIGIGCADGRVGKRKIHTTPGSDYQWDIANEEFMERMTESTKAVIDYFAGHISYINVMRNISVSCDCEGAEAEPVVTPDVGIFAGYDILAVDQACVDVIYSLPHGGGDAMIERMESRRGLRQLSYMKELGMGSDVYRVIDLDRGGAETTAREIAAPIAPGWRPDCYNTFLGRNRLRGKEEA